MSPRVQRDLGEGIDAVRIVALASALALTASYASVLYEITAIVGRSTSLLAVVAGALVLATFVAPAIDERRALLVAGALFVGGYLIYLRQSPFSATYLLSTGNFVWDTIALLTGLSVLGIADVGTWAVASAPAPVFLSWYLTARRRYVTSAVVGGAALSVFVLSGDAGVVVTLWGVIAGTTLVGVGDVDRYGGSLTQADTLALVLALMVVASTIPLVPAGGARPVVPGDRFDSVGTVEESLITTEDRIRVRGEVDLSPEVAFTVESDEERMWRTGAYDRYTGDGWARTGQTAEYDGRLRGPPGESVGVTQTVTVERPMDSMPAAWRPVSVLGQQQREARVTDLGGLQPGTALEAGDRYVVRSERPEYTVDDLQDAGTDYPDHVEERYLQLPESTPDRVGTQTGEVVEAAGAETPYETAVVIERWLQESKNYSLAVDRPDGDVADAFLFEMDAGYCTYFATTMVAMLRSQDVPARLVVGYTSGQRVAEDEWVVRGTNAHAWVEVYFPDVGWVAFDPTPSGPREDVREDRIESAREANESGVDTEESEEGEWTPTPDPSAPETNATNATNATGGPDTFEQSEIIDERIRRAGGRSLNESEYDELTGIDPTVNPPGPEVGDDPGPESGRSPGEVGLGLVLIVGAAAGLRRIGVTDDVYRSLAIHWQGRRRSPEDDVERAYRRAELLLERDFRDRRRGETVASYLDAIGHDRIDDRALRIAEARERARYGPGVTPSDAETAVELADGLARDRAPLPGRIRR